MASEQTGENITGGTAILTDNAVAMGLIGSATRKINVKQFWVSVVILVVLNGSNTLAPANP